MLVKSSAVLLALASTASAFTAPKASSQSTLVQNAFADGMVGGEGPEPMPFTTADSAVNFDPAGFAEVCVTSNVSSKISILYYDIICHVWSQNFQLFI